jgi:hypothetical protein
MNFIKLSDELIRSTLRDYRLKHGKDPDLITINSKTELELGIIYKNTDMFMENAAIPSLYGIPVIKRPQNDDFEIHMRMY